MDKDDLYTMRLMGEINRAENLSQRELAQRLNISLGLVNSFIKRLVNKGYFKVKTMPKNRLKYFLTPAGLARKSRLTVEYLKYSVDTYKDIKSLLLTKFEEMSKSGVECVLFFGSGEVAELAYLYIQLTGLTLTGVIDNQDIGKRFFEFEVSRYDELADMEWDLILMTRLDTVDNDMNELIGSGIDQNRIQVL